ncbi:hypothetical protein PSQ39_21300 [Curvibacter sp. HBC28]|uniref:Uncharacterized protein n=1 Tax=Curvibacter microcysteis TaxID=3026419 RepID=A0ABT5MPM1_9BURK|nr:hypothetical protein [Curvibacter sp. HBC28]MDD0817185.1 hypothetical protein [Curvibacter sp. HBC28]
MSTHQEQATFGHLHQIQAAIEGLLARAIKCMVYAVEDNREATFLYWRGQADALRLIAQLPENDYLFNKLREPYSPEASIQTACHLLGANIVNITFAHAKELLRPCLSGIANDLGADREFNLREQLVGSEPKASQAVVHQKHTSAAVDGMNQSVGLHAPLLFGKAIVPRTYGSAAC